MEKDDGLLNSEEKEEDKEKLIEFDESDFSKTRKVTCLAMN